MSHIDSSAKVDSSAQIETGVVIGPGCVVGAGAVIGANTKLEAYVIVCANTTLGKDNTISAFVHLGGSPQHLKHDPQSHSTLQLGDNNIIREFCAIHAGSSVDKGITVIGSNNMFMNHAHIGHDASVGNNNVVAPGIHVGGHVSIGDNNNFSAMVAIHPFCRVGSYCMIGPASVLTRCVPSFWRVAGKAKARAYGINRIGMQRGNIGNDNIKRVSEAFRLAYSVKPLVERINDLRERCVHTSEVVELLDSLEKANATGRGIVPRVSSKG